MSKRIPRRPPPHVLAVLTALAAGACSSQPVSSAGSPDASPGSETPEAGTPEAGTPEAGSPDARSTNDGGGDAGSTVTDSGGGAGLDAPGEAASCSPGQCPPTILVTTTQPLGLAVDGTTMYWRTGAGGLMSASVDGTGVSTVFASPNDAVGADDSSQMNALVLGPTSAYFLVNRYPHTESYIQAALLDGTGASTFDVDTNIAELEQTIALDATALYVARYNIDPQGGSCPCVGIDVVPLNGGPTTTLHGACDPVGVVVDSSQNLYWTDRGPPPYIAAPSVMTQSVSATTPTKLASAVHPAGIALYGGMLYWSDSGNVLAMPVGGAMGASVLSSSASPGDLVVDSSGVYWIDSGNAIMTAPLGGGAATTLAQGQTNVVSLGTSSTSVFWVNEGTAANGYVDGAVMKVAK
jgi:hypothetical protein